MIPHVSKYIKTIFFSLFITYCSSPPLYAQEIKIETDPTSLDINQELIISLSVPFQKKVRIGSFPEIADFSKKRTIYSREDSLIRIYQHYRPRKAGTFSLPPFSIIVDEQSIPYQQETFIKIASAPKKDSLIPPEHLNDFVQDAIEARLVTEVSSREAYPGETISLRVYLLLSRTGDAEFNFINMSEQLNKLREALIPDSSLNEIIHFGSISVDTLPRNDVSVTRYLLLDALIAPIGSSGLTIGPASFSLLTYAKRKSPGLTERIDQVINLYSRPINIAPRIQEKAYEKLSPGVFSLSEKISAEKAEIDKSLVYEFIIQGNFNNLLHFPPHIQSDEMAKVLPIHKSGNIKNGQSYSFYIVPYKTGEIHIRDLIYWPYFNTSTHQADTLWPTKKILVEGNTRKEKSNYKNDPFYKKIDSESNKPRSLQPDNMLKLFTNLVILFMFAVTVILIIRK